MTSRETAVIEFPASALKVERLPDGDATYKLSDALKSPQESRFYTDMPSGLARANASGSIATLAMKKGLHGDSSSDISVKAFEATMQSLTADQVVKCAEGLANTMLNKVQPPSGKIEKS